MSSFLLDVGVPRTVQKFLEEKGYIVDHVVDLGLASAIDAELYSYAKANQYILITRDKGFGNLLDYDLKDIGVIIIKDINLGAREIVSTFEAAWNEISEEELLNALVIIDRNKVRIRR